MSSSIAQKYQIFREETSASQKISEIGNDLSKLIGLDETETNLYLNLLRTGPITASALSRELKMDRASVYRSINRLVRFGIVTNTFTKPKKCIAIQPEELFKKVIERNENQLNEIKKTKGDLLDEIKRSIPTNYESNIPILSISQGAKNIFSDIERIIENSKGVVYLITTLHDIAKMYHTNIPEKIKECEKNGGKVLLYTELTDPKLEPFVERLGATETRIGKLHSRGLIVVEKDSKMIMSCKTNFDCDDPASTDSAIYTNSKEIINNIHALCSLIWQKGSPLDKIQITTKWHR